MSTLITSAPSTKRSAREVPKNDSPAVVETHLEVLGEASFQNLLRLERKRVERSGRRFVLMLLETGSLLVDPGRRHAFDNLLSTLLLSIRETDLSGWYETERIFGIIFPEVGETGCGQVLQALLEKIGKALSGALTVEQINELKLSFHIYPEPSDTDGAGGEPNFVFYRDLVRDLEGTSAYHLLKRVLDVFISVSALILLSPLLALIALAVRLSSRGPVLFRQQRIGQFCKRFTFLKFRSMYLNSDPAIHRAYVERLISGGPDGNSANAKGSAPVFKIVNDPRVTPLGRFLRRTSLDELPQLLNVLRGEMTLVGPRPCIAYEFNRYEVWHRERLLAVKPGITGLWQVRGRSRVKFDEMVRLDLEYAKSKSIRLDLQILLQTPRAVIWGSGAY